MNYMMKGEALVGIGMEACDVKSRQTDASKWSVLLGLVDEHPRSVQCNTILQQLELPSK